LEAGLVPETILGLDIGSDSIKAVLANATGRMDVRVIASETVRLEDGVDLEVALKRIAEKILPMALSRIRCVVSLPPSDVMFRQIRLPFRDESKIKKTLPFELEPLLPLPIEEVVADYVHLPDGGLLTAAVGKERIKKVLSAVELHLGEVAVIDIATAVLALPLLEQEALTGAGILLDVGASSTVAVFYEKNALVQIRSFTFGGNTITRALAEDLACDPTEAESVKISAAYGTKTGGALAACRTFCVSLANTIELMRLNETLHSPPAEILVTGGGSLFKPLIDDLEKTFGAPIKALDFGRSGQLEIDDNLQNLYSPPIMNAALATVKRAFASCKSFNFRQGEFAAKNVRGDLGKQFKWGAIIVGIILLLAAIDLFLDYQWQAKQVGNLKNQISMVFKKHYPQAQMVDPVAQLRTKLAEDRKTYGMDDGGSGVTVLALLKDMSIFISPAMDIILNHMHYENNIVLLKGEAKNIEDVTNVKNELLKSKYFKNVAINSTSLTKEGAKLNFDLRIELR
jgi:general secretion pathway protein L